MSKANKAKGGNRTVSYTHLAALCRLSPRTPALPGLNARPQAVPHRMGRGGTVRNGGGVREGAFFSRTVYKSRRPVGES